MASFIASKAATHFWPAPIIMTAVRWWPSSFAKPAAMSAKRRAVTSVPRYLPRRKQRRLQTENVRGRNHWHLRALQPAARRADLIAADIPMTAAPTTAYQARPLDIGPVALIVLMCMCWGLNQVAVKFSLPDIPVIMQVMIRSAGGLLIVLFWVWLRQINLFERDGTLVPGVVIGAAVRARIRADVSRHSSTRPRAAPRC